jgi:hypothetical protein
MSSKRNSSQANQADGTRSSPLARFPPLRHSDGTPPTSFKILIAGDWCTDSPQLVHLSTGCDASIWFVPAEGLDNHVMARPYYDGAAGALATATRWKKDIDSRVASLPCILVGNKVHECRAVEWGKTDEEMDLLVTGNGFLNFLRIRELNCDALDRCVGCLLEHVRQKAGEREAVRMNDIVRRQRPREKCF